ncbi:hypothetical protein [Bacillus thuringiensis]|uniref:Group-specific protein n=1 Tax=Bacillus thuringiensis TaxID=1428 RepID=A0A9X7GCV4_BACTU|nr:hypothetical protein [Bacillus thuringiensis]PFL10733.1 hypothetical protein COJ28_02850 [Bacillus thuringiensis]PFV28964.1 hypothetical protein COK99_19225 [Bacillus thuringiensis]PGN19127.1 hypothetical protein CN969_25465 [Bacillus thuringiensis]PGN35104.1 hypothetical protein CN971_01045 [Bacillus thuringiensis]PGU43964.1 hypothetical protein COD63_09935 [Bacillus thuringiensis]
MQKAISFFLLLFCLIVVNETYAYSPKSLPISQNSDQWQVNIDKPKKTNKNMLQAKKDKFQTYHFSVKNVGNSEVYNVNVEVFRNEPNKKTKYELFSLKESRLASGKTGFEHANLPVATKADEVDVIITWQEHPFRSMRNGQKVESRKFKEHFVFKEAKK